MADDDRKLYTLTEVSKKTGISMPTLQRYKKNHQDRLPTVGEGRTQKYPEEALPVFKEIKRENIKRRGRPRKEKGEKKTGRGSRAKSAGGRKGRGSEELLTLTEVGRRTGISYPTLLRYVKLHLDRLPHVGKGRKRRYKPEAVPVFEEIRAASPRGRRKKKKSPAAAAGSGNGSLGQRIKELEKGQRQVNKRLDTILKKLDQPIKLTLSRR